MPYARLVEVNVFAYEPGGPDVVTVVIKYFMESTPLVMNTKDLGAVNIIDVIDSINDVATTGSFQWR